MLRTDAFLLTGNQTDGGLTLAFVRYRPHISSNDCSTKEHVALIFTHNVGTHKETWLPTIERLFELQSASDSRIVIEEAWSMDSPNHGQAAAINDEILLKRKEGITAYNWGRGVQTLLTSSLISTKHIISIGHSAGSCVAVLSTIGYPLTNLPYKSIILVEPPMMPPEILAQIFKSPTQLKQVMDSARTRKDIWPSRVAATEWFRKRFPWKQWHPRTLDLFIEHGLRDLPTATYPDPDNDNDPGVTLSCTREQETVGYIYHQDGVDSLDRLSELCPVLPVHCILGSNIDIVTEETHKAVCDVSKGRKMASVSKVQGAGHLQVVQEKPLELAQAIWDALNCREYEPRSRL